MMGTGRRKALQAGASPFEEAVDRIDRRGEHLGYLARVDPEDVAQDEHGQLARRQDLKSSYEGQRDRLGLFVPSLRPQRHVHHTLEEGVGEWLEPDDLAEAGRLRRLILSDIPLLGRASAGGTTRIEAPGGGDPVEPRADR